MWMWLRIGIVTVLSLLTIIAAITAVVPAFKVDIYSEEEGFVRYGPADELAVSIQIKALVITRVHHNFPGVDSDDYSRGACGIWFAAQRHELSSIRYPNGFVDSVVAIDAWLIAVLTSIYPAIFFIRSYRRRRAHRQALQPCGQCGYDLQGNESGVCPECGEPVVAVA